jgi:hypothetical protein
MGFFSKTKNALEWMTLAKFVADCVVAAASWKLVKKIMSYFPHISPDWASIIAWVVAASVLFLIIHWHERKSVSQSQGPKGQNVTVSTLSTTASPLDVNNVLAKAYNSSLQTDVETNLRNMANNLPPEERDTVMLRFYAVGALSYGYDTIWWTIFRSQILALEGLNKKVLRMEDLKDFYDSAAQQYSNQYAGYSFEQWKSYLMRNTLILDLPGESIGITVRGKDFLKYLVHWGRSASDRKL